MSGATLLTGATGLLGAELLGGLIERGERVVCLVRDGSATRARERLDAIPGGEKCDLVLGDLRLPGCGVSEPEVRRLRGSITRVLHCAACTSFLDEAETAIMNVAGMHMILTLTEELGIRDFAHVSTAYVAGDAPAFAETETYVGQRWRNSYERTKFVGETLLRAWASVPGRTFTVFRPSILAGRADGSCRAFSGYYTFVQALDALAQSMRRRAAKPPIGVSVTPAGTVTLPLMLKIAPTATLNIVPVDWAAKAILTLLKNASTGRTYHIVDPMPRSAQWVADVTLREIGICGMRYVQDDRERAAAIVQMPPGLQRLQQILDSVVAAFDSYISCEAIFGSDAAVETLGPAFPSLSTDEPYFRRILEFARDADWGRQSGHAGAAAEPVS